MIKNHHYHHFCSTDFTPYLDYGGVLAILGLFLTSYFVLSKENLLIFNIRSVYTRFVFIFFSLVASLLVLITPVITCSEDKLIVQIFAYLFFIMSLFSFWFIATYKKKLFINNPRRFLDSVLSILARDTSPLLSSALNLIYFNFEDIISSLKSKDKNLTQNAHSLIEIFLSDKKVVEVIATTDLSFLYKYLDLLEKNEIKSTTFSMYALLKELIFNNQSFLYKHINKDAGLSLSNNIYSVVFSKSYFYNWNLFKRFEVWSYKNKYDNPNELVEVTAKLLTKNIDLYFRGEVSPENVNDGFEQLRNIFEKLCFELTEYKKEEDRDATFNDKTYILSSIIHFFTQDYKFFSKEHHSEEKDKEYYFSQDVVTAENSLDKNLNYDNLRMNIGYSYSYSLIFFLERVSWLPKWFDNWHLTCEIMLFIHHYHYDNHKINYCKLTENILWDHVYDNVTKGHYPNITAIYLKHVTHGIVNKIQSHTDLKEFENNVLSLMYFDIKNKIDSGEQMMNREDSISVLLSDEIIYKDNKFYSSYKKGKELTELPKPNTNLNVLEDQRIKKDGYHISH